jgi:hypothetical protein
MHINRIHQTRRTCKQGAKGVPQRVQMHKVQVGQCCAQGSQTEPKAGETERNGGDANEGDVHRQDRVKTTRRTVDTSRMRNPKITSLHGSACLISSWKFASTQVDNMEAEMGNRREGHKDKSGSANLTCFAHGSSTCCARGSKANNARPPAFLRETLSLCGHSGWSNK